MPPREGCRLPLIIGFLPFPVDPRQMAMARSLRSTGITPLHGYKETTSAGTALAGQGCERHIVAKVSQAFDQAFGLLAFGSVLKVI